MAKICGAVRNKLLLSLTTSDTTHSGHLFSRETTSGKKLVYREITFISLARWKTLEYPLKEMALASPCDSSLPGAALQPFQHGKECPVPSWWECCRSHLFPMPQTMSHISGKPSRETGCTEILQFTEVIMAEASFP